MFLVREQREADQASFVCEMQAMGPRSQKLMAKSQVGSGWGGASSIRRLFGDERNVPAILEFLRETRVGKMPRRVLLTGGPDLEEEELDGFSLQVLEEEDAETEVSSSEEEDRPAPPL